jgi:hypothetical protein
MNQRRLLLTHLLDRTGCTHLSAPSQTSDFWSLQTMTEPDELFLVGPAYSVAPTAAIYLKADMPYWNRAIGCSAETRSGHTPHGGCAGEERS